MEKETSRVEVRIAWSTIVKLLCGVLLAFVAIRLWPFFKLLIISMLLAVALYQIVLWASHQGWPRWAGLSLASAALALAVLGFAAVLGPMAFTQASEFAKDLPKLKEQLLAQLPARGPLREAVEHAADLGGSVNLQQLSEKALAAAKTTLGGLVDLALVVALTIYLMADGPRALQWFVTFFPREQRPRVTKGLGEIAARVVSYVSGQAMVSGLFAVYSFVVLSLLKVPLALVLAVLAGVLDVVPVVGISISLTLAALLGLSVSATTGLLVLVFYAAYHVLENYLIIPKIYGKKLQLSTLAVLLSMIAGGTVAGVIGAVAVLPLIAAYPVLEGLWLAPQLEPEVVTDHQKQRRAA